MAQICGIIAVPRKRKTKDGKITLDADLFMKGPEGRVKIGHWKLFPDGTAKLKAEPGYSEDKIEAVLFDYANEPSDVMLYEACTLAEYEKWLKEAKTEGFAGFAVMECASGYIGKYLTKRERSQPEGEIELGMKDEKDELEKKYPGEKVEFRAFFCPVDFMLGMPADLEDIAG